jgi:hypothetical protein
LLISGLVGGLLIATLQYTQYRFIVIEHSVELCGALVAALFSTFGIWLGLRMTRSRETVRETIVVREVPIPGRAPPAAPFAPYAAQQQATGITAPELEILNFEGVIIALVLPRKMPTPAPARPAATASAGMPRPALGGNHGAPQ